MSLKPQSHVGHEDTVHLTMIYSRAAVNTEQRSAISEILKVQMGRVAEFCGVRLQPPKAIAVLTEFARLLHLQLDVFQGLIRSGKLVLCVRNLRRLELVPLSHGKLL